MKRILLSLITLGIFRVFALPASADVITEWDAAFGGAEADIAYDVQPTRDGGYIAVGFSSQGYMPGLFVVKTDALGNEQWQRRFSLNNYAEQAYRVDETNDGGYILFGSAYLPALLDNRPWLIKLDWVDVGDVAAVAEHWQNHSAAAGWNPLYDRNGDGVVNVVDITWVTMRWGESCQP